MEEHGELPVKLYYRIGEVSDLVGVEPHVLRYWETEFRSIRPQKSPIAILTPPCTFSPSVG